MFHKAVDLTFCDNTTLEVIFQDGEVKQYDISLLFEDYPQLAVLKNRELFISGKLVGQYGIVWNDALDLSVEAVYEDGVTVRKANLSINHEVANAVAQARAKAEISQKELSVLTGIDQSDISKIERGLANPSINTLNRISTALKGKLKIEIIN